MGRGSRDRPAKRWLGIQPGAGNPASGPAPTYTISGEITGVEVDGVLVTLSGDADATDTTSGGDGLYSFGDLPDGSYTVTPTLANHIFAPTSTAVTVSGGDQTGKDFVSSLNLEFPLWVNFEDGVIGEAYPKSAQGVTLDYTDSASSVVRAVGYNSSKIPLYPSDFGYTKCLFFEDMGPGFGGFWTPLATLAPNLSTFEGILRLEIHMWQQDIGSDSNTVGLYDTSSSPQNWCRSYYRGGNNDAIMNAQSGGAAVGTDFMPATGYGDFRIVENSYIFQLEIDTRDGSNKYQVFTSSRNPTSYPGWKTNNALPTYMAQNILMNYFRAQNYLSSGPRDMCIFQVWIGDGTTAFPNGAKQTL